MQIYQNHQSDLGSLAIPQPDIPGEIILVAMVILNHINGCKP